MKTTFMTPCLTFNHQAEEALAFYSSVFEGLVIKNVKKIPSTEGEVFLSAQFELFGQEYMVLNGGESFFFSSGFSFFVHCSSQEEVDEYWAKFLQSGATEMACGWLTDHFGVCWQLIPVEMGDYLFSANDPQKAQRALQAMMQMKKIDLHKIKEAYHGE